MIVLLFVLMLTTYTRLIIAIAGFDGTGNVAVELAIIFVACALELGMMLMVKILRDKIQQLEEDNYNLQKECIKIKHRKDNNNGSF